MSLEHYIKANYFYYGLILCVCDPILSMDPYIVCVYILYIY